MAGHGHTVLGLEVCSLPGFQLSKQKNFFSINILLFSVTHNSFVADANAARQRNHLQFDEYIYISNVLTIDFIDQLLVFFFKSVCSTKWIKTANVTETLFSEFSWNRKPYESLTVLL